MKRFLAICLCSVLALSLTACGPEKSPDPAETKPAVETADPVEPSEKSELVTVTYYHGDEDMAHVVPETAEIPECTPQALMDLLVEKGVLTETVTVNTFSDEKGELRLDLSGSFATQMQSTGSAGETMMMASVVNTFLTTFDATSLLLTVDGEPLTTGHMIYDEALTFYQ